jgi:16S rRNA G527 N7-methylase RsmG
VSHLELLESEFHTFQIELPRVQKLALATYCDELVRWNSKMNLTSLSGVPLVRRLVAEPVWIAQKLHPAGSPAIPFHIVSGFLACHLIEARVKRAAFLRHLAVTLQSSSITVHRARFEDVASSLKSPSWISLQAVALTEEIIDAIRSIASPTTTIVWITSQDTKPILNPIRTFTVPITRTHVFLFNLDLS